MREKEGEMERYSKKSLNIIVDALLSRGEETKFSFKLLCSFCIMRKMQFTKCQAKKIKFLSDG